MKKNALRISAPVRQDIEEGLYRVTANVDGCDIFFESATPPAASAEAFLSAFMLPAMSRNRGLSIDAPVCAKWLENAERIRDLARQWWSFGGGDIEHDGITHIEPEGNGEGLFFGGGVDSHFALMSEQRRLNYIIYVQGYDIELGDAERLERTVAVDNAVARECGVELLTLRTNLRSHPAVRKIGWLKAYGGALAAAGHLLRTKLRSVIMCGWGLVGKSVTRGSHPQLDPYWSSNAVEVSHHGANHSRGDKVRAISGWPVTHKYLRVCYEDKVDGMNCGVCEKCVRTQLEFMAAGRLQDVRTFPARSLSAGIDRIAGLPEHLMYNYEELAEEIDDPAIRFSIGELLLRSPRWQRRENRKAMLRKIWKKIRFRY